MTTHVTVFTKPGCVQCDATKTMLDAKGITYDTADLTDPAVLAEAKALGFTSAPVVVVREAWSGFRPDLIGHLAARVREEAAA
jgi:glutaredoxin-like protein NrdH